MVRALDLEEARSFSKSTDGMEPLKKGGLWKIVLENSETQTDAVKATTSAYRGQVVVAVQVCLSYFSVSF